MLKIGASQVTCTHYLAHVALDLLVDRLRGDNQKLGIGVFEDVRPVLLELSLIPTDGKELKNFILNGIFF